MKMSPSNNACWKGLHPDALDLYDMTSIFWLVPANLGMSDALNYTWRCQITSYIIIANRQLFLYIIIQVKLPSTIFSTFSSCACTMRSLTFCHAMLISFPYTPVKLERPHKRISRIWWLAASGSWWVFC